jgi:sec-independent protein translocase protein TatA
MARETEAKRDSAEVDPVIEDLFTPMHLAVLFAIIFFLFGAKRLPELGKSLGHGIREFRSGIAGVSDLGPEELSQDATPPLTDAATSTDGDVIEGEAHEVPADADEAQAETHEERAAV